MIFKTFFTTAIASTFVMASEGHQTNENITFQNPRIRAIKAGSNTAGYVALHNNFNAPVTIKGVEFHDPNQSFSKIIELHTHKTQEITHERHTQSIKKMQKVESFIIPSKGHHSLQPGTDHIMFIGTTKDIQEGQNIKLKVTFEVLGEDKTEVVDFKVVSKS